MKYKIAKVVNLQIRQNLSIFRNKLWYFYVENSLFTKENLQRIKYKLSKKSYKTNDFIYKAAFLIIAR